MALKERPDLQHFFPHQTAVIEWVTDPTARYWHCYISVYVFRRFRVQYSTEYAYWTAVAYKAEGTLPRRQGTI